MSVHRMPTGAGRGVATVVSIGSLTTKSEGPKPRADRNPKTEKPGVARTKAKRYREIHEIR